MARSNNEERFTVRIPADLYQWLKTRRSMNATILEGLEYIRAKETSEDYRKGFMDGYEKGKEESGK